MIIAVERSPNLVKKESLWHGIIFQCSENPWDLNIRIKPSPAAPVSADESSLPLTFCFKLPSVEPPNPNSCNLSSLTLHHYLSIAGNLKWPSNAPQTHPFRMMDFDSQLPSLMQTSAVSSATESMKLSSYIPWYPTWYPQMI